MAKNRYSAPNSDLWILSWPYSIARVQLNIPTIHFHEDLLNMNLPPLSKPENGERTRLDRVNGNKFSKENKYNGS